MGDDFGYTDNRNQSDVRVLVGRSGSSAQAGTGTSVSTAGRSTTRRWQRVQQQVIGVP
jgi:hypothetical protein